MAGREDISGFNAFLRELGETRITEAMHEAIIKQADLEKVSLGEGFSQVESISVRQIGVGLYKHVSLVEVAIKGRVDSTGRPAPLRMVIKKGEISPQEFSLLKELGELELTSKVLIPELIENVGDTLSLAVEDTRVTNSVSIDEYVPGSEWGTVDSPGSPNLAANRAVGELDAALLLKTLKPREEGLVAYYNRDLHSSNIFIIDVEGGGAVAKIIDFDGSNTFFKKVTAEQYMYSTMARRLAFRDTPELWTGNGTQTVTNMNAYLEGFVTAFERNGSTRAQAIQYLREASSNLKRTGAFEQLLPAEDVPLYREILQREGITNIANPLDAFIATLQVP
jgi:hypothetical protein